MSAPWIIRFRCLMADDAVLAEFENVDLVTPADVTRWAREVDLRLGSFGRKVDLLINLDGLRVRPSVSSEFGKERAAVLEKHSKSSFRFGGDRPTVTSVHTSAVLEHAASNVYESFEAAREALLRSRGQQPGASQGQNRV